MIGEHAQALLAGCTGFLHADGYAGFNRLYQPAELASLTEIGCWAHARRKLYDVHAATNSPLARDALERIAQLFAIEAGINGHAPQHRLATRQAQSLPKLDGLRAFLEQSLATISKKSSLAGAIRYSLARWPALVRFATDGRLEMTNNAAERAIRPLALGRKKLALRPFRRRRPPRRHDLHHHPDRHPQRPRSGSLSPRHPRPHRRAPHQQDRRAPAMAVASSRRSAGVNRKGRVNHRALTIDLQPDGNA